MASASSNKPFFDQIFITFPFSAHACIMHVKVLESLFLFDRNYSDTEHWNIFRMKENGCKFTMEKLFLGM